MWPTLRAHLVRIRDEARDAGWARPLLLALVAGVAARVWLILRFPNNFAFDGWQRWAGRDFVLVQDWLPVVQAVIVAVAHAGGGVQVTRVVLASITALGAAAGVFTAYAMGGRPAAWFFAVLSLFAPYLVWGSLMYQEGTFLAVLLGGLALALRAGVGLSAVRLRGRSWKTLLAADLAFGLLALIRYEGWPIVLCYLVWRRDLRALRALWGMAAWGLVKWAGLKGHYPSRVDYFEDWRGLADRFNLHDYLEQVQSMGDLLLRCGGLAVLVLGLASAGMCWRQRGMPMVTVVLLGQLAATLLWIVGLETATQRMTVIPVVLAAVPLSVGAAELWQRFPRGRALLSAVCVGWALFCVYASADQVDRERARVRPEVVALGRMQACPDCRWWVVPRTGLGARSRDDGCEILQGMTRLRHGEDFWCAPWLKDLSDVEQAARQSQTDGTVRWSGDARGGQYVVDVTRPAP